MSLLERFSHFIAVVGAPGRGKTTLLIEALLKKIDMGDRALVIVPDRNEQIWYPYYPVINADNLEKSFNPNFKGICVIEYKKGVTFKFLLKMFESGKLKDLNLVLDDPNYARRNPEEEIITILSRLRQFQTDAWTNGHSIDYLPPDFFQYITIYGIMYTRAEIKNRLDEVPHLVDVKRRVDRTAGEKREGNPNYHYVEFVNKEGEEI